MKSGLPPSSYAFVRGSVELDLERGRLRESLAALRNLAQLLHSLRVASRPLSHVLPAAQEACEPLRHAMGEILAAVQSTLGEREAAESLQSYVEPRLHELETALGEAAERSLSVKLRLSLEERVTRLSQELDTARGLFDVLADSITGRAIPLDVLDLARQSFSGPPSTSSWPRETLIATLSGETEGLEVEVNPRAVTALIALGVELVASGQSALEVPHITVKPAPNDGCHILIERDPEPRGEDLMLLRRGLIEPSLPCMAAAARANAGLLELEASGKRCSLLFTRTFPGRRAGEAG